MHCKTKGYCLSINFQLCSENLHQIHFHSHYSMNVKFIEQINSDFFQMSHFKENLFYSALNKILREQVAFREYIFFLFQNEEIKNFIMVKERVKIANACERQEIIWELSKTHNQGVAHKFNSNYLMIAIQLFQMIQAQFCHLFYLK